MSELRAALPCFFTLFFLPVIWCFEVAAGRFWARFHYVLGIEYGGLYYDREGVILSEQLRCQ